MKKIMKEQKNHSKIYKIDGVGVDLSRFTPCSVSEKELLRKELGYSATDFIITIVAELNKNKNQIFLLKNVPELIERIPSLKILLIGKNTLPIVSNFIAKKKLSDKIFLLGYRQDVDKLTKMSDVAFSASIREGLPVNIIEAMACGIPVICSNNRGHRSLIKDSENGFIFNLSSKDKMIESILTLYKNPFLRQEMGKKNVIEAKKYSLDIALGRMQEIYKDLIAPEHI